MPLFATSSAPSLSGATIGASRLLPKDFVPDASIVIIGRGKKCLEHEGNKRFRAIVKAELDNYSSAESKTMKTEILMDVLEQVRGEQEICFVKHDPANNRFLAIEDAAARIQIAQAFRDELHGTYRSSKHNKQKRRLEFKKASSENLLATRNRAAAGNNLLIKSGSANATWATTKPMPLALRRPVPVPREQDDAMARLRDIFEASADVAKVEEPSSSMEVPSLDDDQLDLDLDMSDQDCFESLFGAFGSSSPNHTVDPFEPTPIPEEPSGAFSVDEEGDDLLFDLEPTPILEQRKVVVDNKASVKNSFNKLLANINTGAYLFENAPSITVRSAFSA